MASNPPSGDEPQSGLPPAGYPPPPPTESYPAQGGYPPAPPPGAYPPPQGGYPPQYGAPGPQTTGLQPNVASLLAYLFGFIGGLVFFLIEKQNRVVRFHALQSIGLAIAVFVWFIVSIFLYFMPLGFIISSLGYLGFLALWIVLMVKAYQGEMFRLPIIGDIAAQQAGI